MCEQQCNLIFFSIKSPAFIKKCHHFVGPNGFLSGKADVLQENVFNYVE